MGVVALPTEVPLAVASQFDLGNSAPCHGGFRMAASTESPFGGSGGANGTGVLFVLVRSLMAGGAGEPSVVRYRFLPSDLPMTSTTLAGD
jgi:hypothetical protein